MKAMFISYLIFVLSLLGQLYSQSVKKLNPLQMLLKENMRIGKLTQESESKNEKNTRSGDHLNTTLIGRWANGRCYSTFVAGNFAYIGNGGALEILDVSNPASPVSLSRVITPSLVRGIFISGDYAYVANFRDGLRIIDVSNPTSATEVGFYNTSGYANGVFVSGNYAYVADGSDGLRIIDINDPTSPVEVGSYVTNGYSIGIYISGNYAYVADEWDGLRIINISDPTSPVEVGSYNTNDYALGVYVSGSYAYVADGSDGLRIIDVNNPASPVEVGSYVTNGHSNGIYISGNYAYVADGWYGLRIINVSNPSSPVEVGSYVTNGYSNGIYISGNFAYVADEWDGLRIIDVSNSTSPVEIGYYDTNDYTQNIYISGNYAYIAGVRDGLQIIDISNSTSPVELGYYDTNGIAKGVYVSGNYAYVADDWDGLRIIDVSNPASPTEVGYYDTNGSAIDVYISVNYAYVADGLNGLRIIDVSNPASPIEVGYYDTNNYAIGVYVSGNYAYVADDWDGLRIIDVSNPISPIEVGYYDTNNSALGIYVSENYAYVADGWDGLRIIDVSNPSSPIEVGYYNNVSGSDYDDVYISGNYAYVADNWDGLRIIDVSNPTSPTEVGYYVTGAFAQAVFSKENFIYVADSEDGLYIIRNDLIQSLSQILMEFNQIDASTFPVIHNYVTVTDTAGNPITGLTESNFSVMEDGHNESPITVTPLSGTNTPISMALTIDCSENIPGQKITDAKNAAIEFVNNMNNNDEGAIISFNQQVTVDQTFTSDKNLLINAINSLVAQGGTAIYDAIIESVNQTSLQSGRKAIILLTDGMDANSTHTRQEAINAARNTNIPVYTIGLGVSPGSSAEVILQQIADSTGGQYYNAPNSGDLQQLYLAISQQLQNQYKITYTTHNPNPDGTVRTVEITVNYQGKTDTKSKTYTAPNSSGGTPIFASSDPIHGAGTQFWVDVQVGDTANPVTNLLGVSFSLHYTNTQYIDVVSPYNSNVLPGSFMGSNTVFLQNVDDPNGRVDIGITRQAGQGGVSGYGTVARIQFSADPNTPNNTPITFTIDNISANDPNGNAIQLNPQDVTITITSTVVWPGDANNDGTANVADVLPLGLYYNLTGPSRPNASPTWTGQICPPGWNPQNAAYADCNGDGTINVADVLPIGLNYNQTHSKSGYMREWLSFGDEVPTPHVRYSVYDKDMHPTSLSAIGDGESFYLGFALDQASDFVGVSFTLDWRGNSADAGGIIIDRQFGQNGLQVQNDWQPYLLTLHQPLESQKRCEFGFTLKSFDKPYDGSELALLKCNRTGNGALNLKITDVVALDWEGQYYKGSTLVGIGDSQEPLVIGKDFNLRNYPNPFNPTTTIRFALPQIERVWLTVYNALGQRVAELVNAQQLTAGVHEYRFDASTLANGLYFYRLQVGEQIVTKKMLLMK